MMRTVVEPPVRQCAVQSGLIDSLNRVTDSMPSTISEKAEKPVRKTVKKKVAAEAPKAPAVEAPKAAVEAPKAAVEAPKKKAVKAVKVAPAPAPAPEPIAAAKPEPVKKARAKKPVEEKKALSEAAETPKNSDHEEEVKPQRKGRFAKGSEEAKEYMRKLREKAANKRSASAE